eukprot:m.546960 g.546960  ORF g.546960 m.546960 type:complete len:118 (+) comp57695_c0_seq5:1932-2285(+)
MKDEHEDFLGKGAPKFASLNIAKYNWTDHGYPTVRKFLGEALADALENRFQTIQSLTYNFVGRQKDMNTSPFRTALWNYVLRLKGLLNPEYNYNKVVLISSGPSLVLLNLIFPLVFS